MANIIAVANQKGGCCKTTTQSLNTTVMNTSWLLDRLEGYRAFDDEERNMVATTREFVRTCSDCFSRMQSKGHVVASAWVVNHANDHVLLTHHRKLGRWLQLGGHVEDDPDLLTAALREAREESGIKEIEPLSSDIFDVDVHVIPARHLEPEHTHYDIRFLFVADSAAPLIISDESKALKWVQMGDAHSGTSFRRLFAKTKHFFV